MDLLGDIQSFAEARMLTDEEISELEKVVNEYKEVITVNFIILLYIHFFRIITTV